MGTKKRPPQRSTAADHGMKWDKSVSHTVTAPGGGGGQRVEDTTPYCPYLRSCLESFLLFPTR